MIIMSIDSNILIGCCGFPMSRRKYYELFRVVELQETFYNPPDINKLSKLRKEAPNDFTFTMKAWQAITHPPNLATWRRAKFRPPKDKWGNYGFLKPTEENLKAWEVIENGTKALGAKVVVIQLPPSFTFSDANLKNMKNFFSTLKPRDYYVGIEVRGDWINHEAELSELINEYEWLIHIVDPLRWKPVILKRINYFRLHGKGGRYVNYRYKYTDEDLRNLKKYIESCHRGLTYVLFNNIYMRDDALRLIKLFKAG